MYEIHIESANQLMKYLFSLNQGVNFNPTVFLAIKSLFLVV